MMSKIARGLWPGVCLIASLLASGASAQRLATAQDLDSKYACGGGGTYKAETGITWYREWDGCYVKYPSRVNMPHKMWTVGKMDYRPTTMKGGPSNTTLTLPYPGSYSPNETVINNIYAAESPYIRDTINYSAAHLGNYWSVANEPNWGPKFSPTDYAREFNLYSTYIRGLDPTAKMMTGGVLISEGFVGAGYSGTKWYDWLDQFRSEYQRLYGTAAPVDVWDIHPYDLPDYSGGTTPARKAINNIIAMRQYLDSRGMPSARIQISEISELGISDDMEQVAFINELFSWLNQNSDAYKVDKWYWWGSTTTAFGETGLFDGAYDRAHINIKGDAYMHQMGRVFVDPNWTCDLTRIKGSMRNPYRSLAEVMAAFASGQNDIRQGSIIYDFSTGQSWVVPEPSSVVIMCLMGTGLLGSWMVRARK